ncbi:hypothetical protein B0H11DRAFT_2243944 [Mycena galericulata]|nr:hypothetical protein B0H11DRAFT_2243944 [Mycena galericulata]
MLAVTLAFVPAGPGVAQLPAPHPSHAMQPPTPRRLLSKLARTFPLVGNMTCVNYLGYTPTYLDYYIQDTPNNNGYEHPILIARHMYDQSANPPLDKFTAELPSSGLTVRNTSFGCTTTTRGSGPQATLSFQGAVDVAINITGF